MEGGGQTDSSVCSLGEAWKEQSDRSMIDSAKPMLSESVEADAESGDEYETDISIVASVSMWSRKDIKRFKELLRKEGGDGIFKIGHGETMTVRVPTRPDSSCIFWEFATDNYDIGFGLYFEWTSNPGNQVSIHISDSEDDDYDEDEIDESPADIEKGSSQVDLLPLTVIIPICRRDCHEEVYAGSHGYPGQGAYLLKFDNSYSFWRSKMVYFRVYYSR